MRSAVDHEAFLQQIAAQLLVEAEREPVEVARSLRALAAELELASDLAFEELPEADRLPS
jgi:hypothetical protein